MSENSKSPIRKFQKKPVTVEAFEWTGTMDKDIQEFLKGSHIIKDSEKRLIIPTLEGEMTASIGDFIIKGVKGEIYPCKPDIFCETYKEVKDDE